MEEVTINIETTVEEVSINVVEQIEAVTINVYPGLYIPGNTGIGLPHPSVRYKSQEDAIADGLLQDQNFWLDTGTDVGVPGTLMIVL